MKPITRILSLLPIGLLAGLLPAQTHYRPVFEATHEGNGTFTYPFGRGYSSATQPGEGAFQTILESSYVTSLPTGLIAALYFRHDGETFTKVWQGFTQDVVIQMATVTTAPQAMTVDPVGNLGGATPITVFNGPLNVPASNAQPIAPRAFFPILLNAPYAYNAYNATTMSLENLLIDVRVTPLPDTSKQISIDSVLYRSAYPSEGDYEAYVADCVNLANQRLTLVPSKTNLNLGGTLDVTLTAKLGTTATPGLFPAAMLAFGASHSEVDLTVLGLNGCWWSPSLDATSVLADAGAGFPAFSAPIPNVPALAGAAVYTQAFGLGLNASLPSLADSVTSEAFWMKLGPNPSQAYWPFQMIFTNKHLSGPWFISNAGPWGPVMAFSGAL